MGTELCCLVWPAAGSVAVVGPLFEEMGPAPAEATVVEVAEALGLAGHHWR